MGTGVRFCLPWRNTASTIGPRLKASVPACRSWNPVLKNRELQAAVVNYFNGAETLISGYSINRLGPRVDTKDYASGREAGGKWGSGLGYSWESRWASEEVRTSRSVAQTTPCMLQLPRRVAPRSMWASTQALCVPDASRREKPPNHHRPWFSKHHILWSGR